MMCIKCVKAIGLFKKLCFVRVVPNNALSIILNKKSEPFKVYLLSLLKVTLCSIINELSWCNQEWEEQKNRCWKGVIWAWRRAGPGESLCESNTEQPDGADRWSFTNWTSPVSGVETKAKMMPEPLKSALSIGNVEDTSLALPSDRELRSAQQRVREQVHTIKRSKSKYSSKSVSGLTSPTSECTSAHNTRNQQVFFFTVDMGLYGIYLTWTSFSKAFHGITIFFCDTLWWNCCTFYSLHSQGNTMELLAEFLTRFLQLL